MDISYYLENNLGELCSESINLKKNSDYNCEKFYKNLEVTDLIKANFITFDFKSFKAIKNNQKFREMQWGVWHVKNSDDFQKLIKFDNTKYILPLNNTNLSNLN